MWFPCCIAKKLIKTRFVGFVCDLVTVVIILLLVVIIDESLAYLRRKRRLRLPKKKAFLVKLFRKSSNLRSLPESYQNLSAVADSEYCERESSSALTNNQPWRNIFRRTRSGRDVRLCGFLDGGSSRFCHQTPVRKTDIQMVVHLKHIFY